MYENYYVFIHTEEHEWKKESWRFSTGKLFKFSHKLGAEGCSVFFMRQLVCGCCTSEQAL